jgi:glycosyltransferase involved in cell wall biosynthesis
MNILIIAPLPQTDAIFPLTGNSLPVKLLVERLEKEHVIEVIDLSKEGYESGFNLNRVFKIFQILWRVWNAKAGKDKIYLTVAQSLQGNIRDIFIYFICYAKLKNTTIHMLGGNKMRDILQPSNVLQFRINRFFLRKLNAVIVEGKEQKDTFSNAIDSDKIHIVPNFAEDFLINSEENIVAKFNNTDKLNVLFLSNLLEGKGHQELLEGFLTLDQSIREKIYLNYAGGFENEKDKKAFLDKIKNQPNITYHGSVKGEVKKNLFHNAHVFCMPTYYRFEGQPFAIIEAYAGGCCVITTTHSGIGHIFKDEINGIEVEKKSVTAVSQALIRAVNEKELLLKYGLNNLKEVKERYTQQQFLNDVHNILF